MGLGSLVAGLLDREVFSKADAIGFGNVFRTTAA
jgi:hypothetical protein